MIEQRFPDQMPPAPEPPPAADRERVPWGPVEIGLTLLLILLAFVVLGGALSVLRAAGLDVSVEGGSALGSTVALFSQLILNLTALGIAAAFSLGKYHRKLTAWGLGWPPRLRPVQIIVTLGLCYAAFFGYGVVTQLLPFDILRPESNVPRDLFDRAAVIPLAVFFILVVAPLTEEMFFRGFLYRGLASRFGFWPGALASGFVFASIHGSVGLIVPITAISVCFAWVLRRTGSLWNAIAAHFLFNGVSLLALYFSSLVES